MSQKIKFLKDCGPKWPKDGVTDLTPDLQRVLDVAGYVKPSDYDAVVEDVAGETGRVIDEAMKDFRVSLAAEVRKTVDEIRGQLKKPDISFGPDALDKDLKRGFRNMAEFGAAVIAHSPGCPPEISDCIGRQFNLNDSRTKLLACHRAELSARGRTVGSDEVSTLTMATGGALVPTQFQATLWQKALDVGQIVSLVRRVPMSGPSIEYPCNDETTHASDSVRGGVIAYTSKEKAQFTSTSQPAFGKVRIDLTELTVMIPVTNQMLRYSVISLEPLLGQYSSEAIAFKLDGKIMDGSGAGEPEGIKNAAAKIAVSRHGTYFDAIDVNAMWCRQPLYGARKPIWVMSQMLKQYLPTLNQASGTAGALLFVPPGGYSGVPYETLYGCRIVYSEHCQAAGTAGDVYLIDPQEYILGEGTGGVEYSVSAHLRFDYNEMVFRWVLEVDGRCLWRSALTPKHGDTLSPYIVLT